MATVCCRSGASANSRFCLAGFTQPASPGTFRVFSENMYKWIDPSVRYGSLSYVALHVCFAYPISIFFFCRLLKPAGGGYVFHYLNSEQLTFLCLATHDMPQDSAFSYLNEVFMHFFTVFNNLVVDEAVNGTALLRARACSSV